MRRHIATIGMANKSALIAALTLNAVCITLLACGLPTPDPGPSPVPTITVAPSPKSIPHRGKITALFCDDATGSYDRRYFNAAKQLLIKSFTSAVQPNQDGVTLYVTTINSDPVAPKNSLDPLMIPPIGDYPPRITPIPYPPTNNPFTAKETNTAIDKTNVPTISAYNGGVAEIDALVQSVAKEVHDREIKRLEDWNPAVDNVGTSVFGCLYLAKTRLQTTDDIKELFIASDLKDNVTTSLTNDFVPTRALEGVSVHVIFLPGTTGDNTTRARWCRFFHAAGAPAVRFDDTATSQTLSDLFNVDLHLSSTC